VATYLISGATGFIGGALVESLRADGHKILRLTRHSAAARDRVRWDPEAGQIDRAALTAAGIDVVINLAGEPIAQRWTESRKRRIWDSRVLGTGALARALAELHTKPRVFVSGSAIGYYGAHRGDEVLDERSAAGIDFLSETAKAWERAAGPASDAGIRTVSSRTGVVLGAHGGALAKMLLPFRLGMGGRLGNGKQWMSWISLEDTVRALRFLADATSLTGPVNLVAPAAVSNADFTRALGRVLRRPALIPVPAFVLRLLFGTMADNTVLASQRVVPEKLTGAGFEFRHPLLEDALRAALRR